MKGKISIKLHMIEFMSCMRARACAVVFVKNLFRMCILVLCIYNVAIVTHSVIYTRKYVQIHATWAIAVGVCDR